MSVDTHPPAAATADDDLDRDRQDEISSLRETIRDICATVGGTVLARNLAPDGPGYDERAWDLLARQVGVACLGLPAQAGGAGGLAELVAVTEELGVHLLPVPFLSSTVLAGQVLAGAVLTEVGGAGAATALADVAAGQVTALAVTDTDGAWCPDHVQVTLRDAGDDSGDRGVDTVLLDGVVPFVLDGPGARAFVVAARPAGEGTAGKGTAGKGTAGKGTGDPDLFLVDAADPGVAVRRLETLDLTRAQARVIFTGAPATRLTRGGTADAVLGPALDVAGVVLAAEQLGGAQACLDMTVAYVKDRRQFGRPVGGFQAVKHLCADLLVQVEMSRSAVDRAVLAAGTPAFAEASAVAQAWCSDAFRTVSAETVQLHGGIGFTWEHDAHLYFRRARADAVLLGGAAHHRARLATLLAW